METNDNEWQSLLHTEENLVYENYLTDEQAIFEEIKLKAGKSLVRESVRRFTLMFLLSGEIDVSTQNIVNRRVTADNMFLVGIGDNFFGRAVTDAVLLRCSFTQEMAFCNKFVLKSLMNYAWDETVQKSTDIVLLPIHPLLRQELNLNPAVMKKELLRTYYQHFKQDIIFIELTVLYMKEELARMFAPLFCLDDDFKIKVLEIYPMVSTTKELIERLQMSPSTFKRKFCHSFHVPPKQWLIQKRKEKLLRDIVMTHSSMDEIAEKYNLTINYLFAFCKKQFGKTPTELRQEYPLS